MPMLISLRSLWPLAVMLVTVPGYAQASTCNAQPSPYINQALTRASLFLEQEKPQFRPKPATAQAKTSRASFDRARQPQAPPQERLAKLRQQDRGNESDRLQRLRQRQKPAPKRDGPDLER